MASIGFVCFPSPGVDTGTHLRNGCDWSRISPTTLAPDPPGAFTGTRRPIERRFSGVLPAIAAHLVKRCRTRCGINCIDGTGPVTLLPSITYLFSSSYIEVVFRGGGGGGGGGGGAGCRPGSRRCCCFSLREAVWARINPINNGAASWAARFRHATPLGFRSATPPERLSPRLSLRSFFSSYPRLTFFSFRRSRSFPFRAFGPSASGVVVKRSRHLLPHWLICIGRSQDAVDFHRRRGEPRRKEEKNERDGRWSGFSVYCGCGQYSNQGPYKKKKRSGVSILFFFLFPSSPSLPERRFDVKRKKEERPG